MLIIDDCNNRIADTNVTINEIRQNIYDLDMVILAMKKEINEKRVILGVRKNQFYKSLCICQWNTYVYDICAVCFDHSKLFLISCKNNHFFVEIVLLC